MKKEKEELQNSIEELKELTKFDERLKKTLLL